MTESDSFEEVNHPSHYQGKNMEVIEVMEAFDLPQHLSHALKYLLRAGKKKNSELNVDLDKCIWWIKRYKETI